MRWPFGPPHLTLKPSKKNKKLKNTKEIKKEKKEKKWKKTNKGKNTPKTKIPPKKKSFSVISHFFLFLVGVQNFPFLTTWPKKRAPKIHYKNRGFSNPFCGKQFWVTKRPFLDKKKPNPEIPVIIFFWPFSSPTTTKNTKVSWNPYFYSVSANLKKENFQHLNSKHRKLKNPIFAPFFWKSLFFRKLANNWEQKNTHTHTHTHTMIAEQKKIAWNPYFYSVKMTLAQLLTLTWPNHWLWKWPNLAQLLTSQHIYIYI